MRRLRARRAKVGDDRGECLMHVVDHDGRHGQRVGGKAARHDRGSRGAGGQPLGLFVLVDQRDVAGGRVGQEWRAPAISTVASPTTSPSTNCAKAPKVVGICSESFPSNERPPGRPAVSADGCPKLPGDGNVTQPSPSDNSGRAC